LESEVNHEFSCPAPRERVWAALTDPRTVAACLPGGELLEVVDERSFRGAIGVSLGPLRVRFEGRAWYETLAPDDWRAVLRAEAAETRGRAAGSMRMRSRLEARGAETRVHVRQALELHGSLGRFVPPPVLAEAARYALGRFGASLRDRLASTSGG
jgi:carbon monoxide dehydrogenase subunit G